MLVPSCLSVPLQPIQPQSIVRTRPAEEHQDRIYYNLAPNLLTALWYAVTYALNTRTRSSHHVMMCTLTGAHSNEVDAPADQRATYSQPLFLQYHPEPR